jgi:hypothetical protein
MKPVAIAVADLHLSDKPPTARSTEKDWYGYMQSCLSKLREVQDEISQEAKQKIPILYAGDIFHTFNEPAAVINMAMAELPPGLAIPGQHDLEHHQYKNIKRTAYWTLVEAGTLTNLEPYERVAIGDNVRVTGFPWDTKPKPSKPNPEKIDIALIHRYVWSNALNSFIGASKSRALPVIEESLNGYKFAVFGDNHITWCASKGDPITQTVINCGCFLQRRIDERFYQAPRIWILNSDGSVHFTELDTSVYSWNDAEDSKEEIKNTFDASSLMTEFHKLASTGVDFLEQIRRFAEHSDLTTRTKELLQDILKEFKS